MGGSKATTSTPPPRDDRVATATLPVAASLDDRQATPDFLEHISISFARRHAIIACAASGSQPEQIVIADSKSAAQADIVMRLIRRPMPIASAPRELILEAINRSYEAASKVDGNSERYVQVDASEQAKLIAELELHEQADRDLLDGGGRAPVVKLINIILLDAIKAGASDVHLLPTELETVVRTRVDGVLHDSLKIPRTTHDEVISRVKVMGRMNIAEKRLPQDGRASVEIGSRRVDLRIATLPTNFGERAVIRLLDKSAQPYRLGELGMSDVTLERFRRLIRLEHGLILVTGPTGSGKTTTLYAALKEVDYAHHNVLTLEDPIEYRLDGVSQTQISEKKGMTFATGLRSVLRQDPDVIMVGEIRDRETAVMAIQSAMTGHLVFSTLHTNDAASAVTRLLDLGIEPYLVSSSLAAVLAQRLVRTICKSCASTHALSEADGRWLSGSKSLDNGAPPTTAPVGTGCPLCRQTGFRGRLGVFELLTLDDAMRHRVEERASAAELKRTALGSGMQTMREDGVFKVLNGVTTCEEVQRVTVDDIAAIEPANDPRGESRSA